MRLEDTVFLDPAVALRDVAPRPATMWSKGPPVRRGTLLLHRAVETIAMVPPMHGLAEFLDALRTPVAVGELIDADDLTSNSLPWQLIANLVARGFVHQHGLDIGAAREQWRASTAHGRRIVVGEPGWTAGDLIARVAACARPPRVEVAAGAHEPLVALADAVRAGGMTIHTLDVEVAPDGQFAPPVGAALRDLLARVHVGVTLAELARSPLVATLVRERIPVVWEISLGRELLDAGSLDAIIDAATAARVSGLGVTVEWGALGGDAVAEAAYASLVRLAEALGDVRTRGLASDDELTQLTIAPARPASSALEQAVRDAHLEHRATYLEQLEGHIVWGQDPTGEERWVPIAHDLLPNQPALLALGDGATLVDIGGGFGRVARRLAPQVGPHGLVISVDREPIFLDRARTFANELGTKTLQFRVGLGQRLPLADDTADAAVLEWGGEIHRDGLMGACVREMRRVVRPNGRVAVTYRLANLDLEQLDSAVAPYPTIYPVMCAAIADAGLELVGETFWGVKGGLSEAPLAAFEERYVPRLVDDLRGRQMPKQRPTVDMIVTVIARKPVVTR